ncbi:MAG: two-component system response regulator CreB [Bdellovibrionales bacterium]|nr:two-component system response regulator CreB [Bdellovibrionales bacterium]
MAEQILIIEDEPSIADNITYALSTEGFGAHWCNTAAAGLEHLRENETSLVVLDVGLPDASGFDVAREIRSFSEVPIIFLTARAEEIDRVVGLELGADDYVVKPFSPRELVARIRAVLRRSLKREQESVEAEHSQFTINEQSYLITYQGEKLDLTRYEFRLLRILVKSPGRVYSREHLMQLAWEEPDMSLERTVDTHIKTIRHKLKKITPQTDPIITHRGIGYSLKEDE